MKQDIVLCVDDDTTVLSSLRTLLGKTLGDQVMMEVAESGEEALEICTDLQQDGLELAVVISDFIMPGLRGDEFLVRLHDISPRSVKIMLTGQSDLDGIKRAINEANLYRFLEKPFSNADLVLIAQTALQNYRQSTELERRTAALEPINLDLEGRIAARMLELAEIDRQLGNLSVSDSLTGLCNRLRLDQVLEDELSRSQRYGSTVAVVLLNLDHFKVVNAVHGHHVGDEVLVAMAGLASAGMREVDTVGRWGGEEFLLICPDTTQDGALAVAEKLRQAIASHVFPRVGKLTGSVGVTALRGNESVATMMTRADAALRRAKGNGRNRVELDA